MSELLINFSQNYVPTRITGVDTLFKQVTFYGYSGFNASGIPNLNTAPYYVGKNSGQLYMGIPTGNYVSLQLPTETKDALNNFYIAGKINDKAYIIYY